MDLISIDSLTDSDSDYEQLMDTIILRQMRQIREKKNFFQYYNDSQFRIRFRMSKEAAWSVYICIKERLPYKKRKNSMSRQLLFLLALRFYASGGFQMTVGDIFDVSKSTASRAITIVTHHIALLRKEFIYMPRNQNECLEARNNFYKVAKFPRVIGAMDCTHIKIQSPGKMKIKLYVVYFIAKLFFAQVVMMLSSSGTEKVFFSLNVQTVCNSDLQIMDIVARWPGSVHDSRIFRNSRICYRLESGEFHDAIIVGDSGYENNNIVLTPLLNCTDEAENLYNESHIRTRNCVERLYGVWKRRFPALSMGIRMHIDKVPAITVATAVLHNVCCQHGDMAPPPLETSIEQAVVEVLSATNVRASEIGRVQKDYTRRTLIQNHFGSL